MKEEDGRKEKEVRRSEDKNRRKKEEKREKTNIRTLDNEARTVILARDECTVAYEVKIQPPPPHPSLTPPTHFSLLFLSSSSKIILFPVPCPYFPALFTVTS